MRPPCSVIKLPLGSLIQKRAARRTVTIERQLAHAERNGVRRAYNHEVYSPERRKMMQWWADYLDEAAKKG
jgi:hypothetical protein